MDKGKANANFCITQSEKKDQKSDEFEIAVMLAVNEKLFRKGHITEEIYYSAKERILTI